MRRLIVVSYAHPPHPGIGGTRWLAMARYLRELGHSVTIVASRAWGTLPDDSEAGVVRVGDLRSARPLRQALRRGELRVAGHGGLEKPPTALLTKVLVPDMNVATWLPALVVTVRRLLASQPFDCLVTSSPPESSHLLGLVLGERRCAWVADFRDGWAFEPHRDPFPTGAQRTLDLWLERRVVRSAEVVVGATQPIADDLRGRLAGRRRGWPTVGTQRLRSNQAVDCPRSETRRRSSCTPEGCLGPGGAIRSLFCAPSSSSGRNAGLRRCGSSTPAA